MPPTYSHTATCPNCGDETKHEIPFGIAVKDHMRGLEKESCVNCGVEQETDAELLARMGWTVTPGKTLGPSKPLSRCI